VDTVTIVTWHKRPGDTVSAGEALFAVETDKAVLDVEAPASGELHGVTAAEGDEVPALSRIAWIGADREGVLRQAQQPAPAEPRPGRAEAMADQAARGVAEARSSDRRRFASPYARTLAGERELDWTVLDGSGPMGAVLARDVEAVRPSPRSPITPLARRIAHETDADISRMSGTGHLGRITRDDVTEARREIVETFALTGIRGRIAERMQRGTQDTAPVTLTTEVDATRFVEARQRVIADGLRVSYNDILLQIVSRALLQHPRLNATYEGDRAIVRRETDIALAVDTDRGLLAPVVRGVQALSLPEIGVATARIIERARNGQITPDELHGSTFTVTNLGMFGIDAFTPIINVPECAILGVGRIKPTPWAVGDCIGLRQAMWLSLTFDHRLVDGGPAARFLQAVAQAIEAGG
jgi:pyruvate dehydrogenase E2 component (dihydrolipoamide acetyltransferase)